MNAKTTVFFNASFKINLPVIKAEITDFDPIIMRKVMSAF